MKKKKDINFSFSFKDLKERNISYYATFSAANRLEIALCTKTTCTKTFSESVRENIDNNKTWQIFYDNATFDSILKDIKPPEPNLESPDNYLPPSDNREFLEQIRDEPYCLGNPIALVHFAEMINEMKWNTQTAKQLRKDFIKYFIPEDIKDRNRKRVPPTSLPFKLLKELAHHISNKCKKILKNLSAATKTDFTSHEYDELIRWASDNEPRICRVKPQSRQNMINSMKAQGKNKIPIEVLLKGYALNMKQLKELIFKPSGYAEKRLLDHLRISPSTLYRRK